MKPRTLGFLLGVMLGIFAWVGNLQRADTLTVSIFPDLLTPLAVPILLYLALRYWDRRHQNPSEDVRQLRRAGWGMVHAQAAVFALFIAVLTAERSSGDVPSIAAGFTSALVITAGVGYISVEVWARLLVAVRVR